MTRPLLKIATLLAVVALAHAQPRNPDADAPPVLFEERVQVAPSGGAVDVAFGNQDLEIVNPTNIVWIADPGQTGVVAIASRPIVGTAKAGEKMGTRGPHVLRNTAAMAVSPHGVFTVSETGMLTVLGERDADSLQVGRSLATAIDVDVNANGLIFVLWGARVDVFTTPPRTALWSFEIEEDARPAVALSASATGEVFVVGQGPQAVSVYDLDDQGRYVRTRSVDAGSLGLESPGGVVVTPFMLLPIEEREGWADRDLFVLVSDTATGALVALERADLSLVGRWDLRQNDPGAAPGRLAVSNRGQIAYVDPRAAEAWVLPTPVMVALVEGGDFRWRILTPPERKFRVQGGDTLQIPR